MTAAELYAIDCKRRGAMMQGGFGFLHPDTQHPWKLAAELVSALQQCAEAKMPGEARRIARTAIAKAVA